MSTCLARYLVKGQNQKRALSSDMDTEVSQHADSGKSSSSYFLHACIHIVMTKQCYLKNLVQNSGGGGGISATGRCDSPPFPLYETLHTI